MDGNKRSVSFKQETKPKKITWMMSLDIRTEEIIIITGREQTRKEYPIRVGTSRVMGSKHRVMCIKVSKAEGSETFTNIVHALRIKGSFPKGDRNHPESMAW